MASGPLKISLRVRPTVARPANAVGLQRSAISSRPWQLGPVERADAIIDDRARLPALDPLLEVRSFASITILHPKFGMRFSPHEPRRAFLHVEIRKLVAATFSTSDYVRLGTRPTICTSASAAPGHANCFRWSSSAASSTCKSPANAFAMHSVSRCAASSARGSK